MGTFGLATSIDLWQIVAWSSCLSPGPIFLKRPGPMSLESDTLACLKKAYKRQFFDGDVLVHHDRGSTYTAKEYQDELKKMGGISSMSRKGSCWNNAVAESTFSTIKTELFSNRIPEDLDQVNRELFEYIEVFYNRKRLHSSLGYITPMEKEALARRPPLAA
jgi:transposase InsO family protein